MSLRTEELSEKIEGLTDPDSIMLEIMSVFRETEIIPDVGKYYTFIYLAKTPGITFDTFPLIACTEILPWGFRGLNYHWGTLRNYTWQEVSGLLYVIKDDEIDYIETIKYTRLLTK